MLFRSLRSGASYQVIATLSNGRNMMRALTLLGAFLCITLSIVVANPAQAAGSNQFSYVSATGSDGNNCSSPAEACATFAGALGRTASYGEIDCVNVYFYGESFIIGQSVTIDCAGGVGATFGQIIVNAPDIVVRLRNITFAGVGNGSYAVDARNMAALHFENCVIANFNALVFPQSPYIGIKFEPSADAQLFVTNSVVSANGSSNTSLSGGIYIAPASEVTATVSINRSEIKGNYFGIVGDGRSGGTIRATIRDSVISGNTENGITALSSGASTVFLVDQTEVSGNLAGLYASGSNAGMLASNSTVFNNTIGLETAGGGTLYTYGNNRVNGNATNGAFTGTAALQ
jgi:Periplasmic copper-binding protein (NosD)